MKKDWHTQTIRNIRKVWEAEQAVEEERKKTEIRMKELKAERDRMAMIKMQEDAGLIPKRGERVEWMYAGPNTATAVEEEREAYLLGRKRVDVGKLVDEKDDEPLSLLQEASSSAASAAAAAGTAKYGNTGITPENEQRDLENKIREDPLFAIRMREKRQMDQVMSNPLKMKALSQKDSDKKKSKKKHRRSRSRSRSRSRDRHRHRRREASPDDDRRRHHHHRDRSRSPPRTSRYDHDHQRRSRHAEDRPGSSREKMDEAERERKLEEMRRNAQQMHEQRRERVAAFQAEEDREAKEYRESRQHDGSHFRYDRRY